MRDAEPRGSPRARLQEVHALSFAVMELPWLLLLVLIVVTPFYFMVGLNSSPGFYFFFILVVWQMGFTFISVGMLAAAVFPTAAVAQTVIGIAIPLCFLFGGLYLPCAASPLPVSDGRCCFFSPKGLF